MERTRDNQTMKSPLEAHEHEPKASATTSIVTLASVYMSSLLTIRLGAHVPRII